VAARGPMTGPREAPRAQGQGVSEPPR
jgi:hypothetical protein